MTRSRGKRRSERLDSPRDHEWRESGQQNRGPPIRRDVRLLAASNGGDCNPGECPPSRLPPNAVADEFSLIVGEAAWED
jgi:hypothetical protein